MGRRAVGDWSKEIDGADVSHLAGRSVNCATRQDRAEIWSRGPSTAAVGAAIAKSARPPRTWLQASTATIYSIATTRRTDEHVGILGVARGTRQTPGSSASSRPSVGGRARRGTAPSTRKVALRSAVVMSPTDAARFATAVGTGASGTRGRAGDGASTFRGSTTRTSPGPCFWIIEHDRLGGVVNVSAPSRFRKRIRGVRSDGRRGSRRTAAMKWMLEIGALLLRTETELILKSRRVVPTRLLESGFRVHLPELDEAA